jgi:hypothetical protein
MAAHTPGSDRHELAAGELAAISGEPSRAAGILRSVLDRHRVATDWNNELLANALVVAALTSNAAALAGTMNRRCGVPDYFDVGFEKNSHSQDALLFVKWRIVG